MEIFLSLIKAFVIGGLICTVAQILIDRTKLTPARILVGYVIAGVILGAIGIYKPIVDFAGGGATVPLSGFGYLISDGVRKAVDRDGFIGILTGGLSATAGGITAAMFFGLIAAIIFKSKPKNKS
jgi:stage V sporulation protein AE